MRTGIEALYNAPMLTRYICSHCGRRFEAEPKDIMECPGCFWSTTVKKEEDAEEKSFEPRVSPPEKKSFKINFAKISVRTLPFLILFLATGVLVANWPKVSRFLQQREASLRSKKMNGRAVIKAGDLDVKIPTLDQLSEEEKATLNRRIDLAADRPMDEEEIKILRSMASLRTGKVERLPSQAWTIEGYKQMIAEQEKFYKVPLPGSYKDKLVDLFKKKYLPAEEAFKAGNLLEARNLWVESLAFPIYGKTLEKHRGVALTMLRLFINDTLSKIGAINGTLTEQKVRDLEQSLIENYTEFRQLVDEKSWPEAAASALKLEQMIKQLETPDQLPTEVPSYPPAVNQVDEGIRTTLVNLLHSNPPAVTDLASLAQDVAAKKNVIESFLPENLAKVKNRYDQALEFIRLQNWQEAEKLLRQIEYPPSLVRDSQEKVKVLKKLQKPAP